MRITGPIAPTNPFHIARAYGVSQPAAPRATTASPVQAEIAPMRAPLAASRLVAAVVPGKVDFDAPQTAGAAGGGGGGAGVDRTMQLYRHPADRNIAATGVTLGRAIDVSG